MANIVTFKYNGRIYKAQHLKNKLKKLNCTEADIEIIPDAPVEEEKGTLTFLYLFNVNNHHTIQKLWHDLSVKPNKDEIVKPMLWNEETKTGFSRDFNPDEWILLDGIPKYPINMIGDLPELVEHYDWK